MGKKKIPNNTDTFTYTNVNPKGKHTDDCTIRALSLAMEKPYEDVYKELFMTSLKTGYFISAKENIAKYLKEEGWIKMPQPRSLNNKRMRASEWCFNRLSTITPKSDRIIANLGQCHIAAIINCKVCDIWDSSIECIGNYWIKA